MIHRLLIPALALSVIAFGCQKQDDAAAAGGHAHEPPPHGGLLVEVGDHAALLEVLHDEAAGTMTIHAYLTDHWDALALTKAPVIVLTTDAGTVPVETASVATATTPDSVFSAQSETLKAHLHDVRITVEIGGKVYNPELPHAH